jgi:hypothetical protein
VDAARLQCVCAPQVIDIVRVAAVDNRIAAVKQRRECVDRGIDGRCRDH